MEADDQQTNYPREFKDEKYNFGDWKCCHIWKQII